MRRKVSEVKNFFTTVFQCVSKPRKEIRVIVFFELYYRLFSENLIFRLFPIFFKNYKKLNLFLRIRIKNGQMSGKNKFGLFSWFFLKKKKFLNQNWFLALGKFFFSKKDFSGPNFFLYLLVKSVPRFCQRGLFEFCFLLKKRKKKKQN
jgi:hypothetical protein